VGVATLDMDCGALNGDKFLLILRTATFQNRRTGADLKVFFSCEEFEVEEGFKYSSDISIACTAFRALATAECKTAP